MSILCTRNSVYEARVPMRATYVNLYKWPESDAEFVKAARTAADMRGGEGLGQPPPRVVDSVSCRQMYLRSYTFSRKESVSERTKKCFGKFRERAAIGEKNGKVRLRRRRCMVSMKKMSCAALSAIFSEIAVLYC